MISLPETSYYLDPWNDEVIPCDTTLEGWAEWLSKPAENWNRPEPARDGERFTASVVSWDVDIVATRREGGEWTFNREIPAHASILAVRFGEGLGWDYDSVAHDEAGLRQVLGEIGGTEVGDTELIAVGVDQPQVTLVYRAAPPLLEVTESDITQSHSAVEAAAGDVEYSSLTITLAHSVTNRLLDGAGGGSEYWKMRAAVSQAIHEVLDLTFCSVMDSTPVQLLTDGLRSIAEGNLGDGPGQANYARIREVAAAALDGAYA